MRLAHVRSATARPRLMPYRRLMVTVVVVNLAVLFHHVRHGDWRIADGTHAVGAVGAGAGQRHGGGSHPAADLSQHPLRAGRPWLASWPLWVRWSVSKVHHVGGLHAGCAARRNGMAVRVHRRGIRDTRCSPRQRHGHDARAVRRPRRPDADRDGVRDRTGPHPCAQRVRAVASLGRLDGDRALLGADNSPRASWARRCEPTRSDRVGLARVGPGDPDRERRVALAAVASRARHGSTPVRSRRDRPPRLWRAAGLPVGGRHQSPPVARMARLRHGDVAGPDRVPPAHLPGRRLDGSLHR